MTSALGAVDPEHCIGIHITLGMGTRPNVQGKPDSEEARALKGMKYYLEWDSGYSEQQATRPQTERDAEGRALLGVRAANPLCRRCAQVLQRTQAGRMGILQSRSWQTKQGGCCVRSRTLVRLMRRATSKSLESLT